MKIPHCVRDDMRKIIDILKEAETELEQAGIESPDVDARLLFQHVTELSREDILLKPEMLIEDVKVKSLKKLIARRAAHEPVSRIIGHRDFWKHQFKISPETLDPRSDSETLVEGVLSRRGSAKTILDLGTGSGCLLLSILGDAPEMTGVGIDISEGAIDVARENAQSLGFTARALFEATGWEAYAPKNLFDIVISNPPYIAWHEGPDLEPEVAEYDPDRALFGGEDGLAAYREIALLLPEFLKPEGLVFFEIGATQAKNVTDILAKAGYDVIHTCHDLAKRDRVLVAKKSL